MAKEKANRPQARLPRGLADRSAEDIRATERMMATIRAVYERYGFEPVETPFIEYADTLGKFLPDQDRPNEGVFAFQDDDEQWLALRYDLTAPLARHVAENYDRLAKPFRSYRSGWVFRNEKPGPGRFRQFLQFDADTVGSRSPAADAEMCMMAADALEALGVKRGQYVIKVNSRKVLDGVMEAIGVADPRQRLAVLRAIDKLDRLGIDGVRQLLGKGRKDESGDFTKGAELNDGQVDGIVGFLSSTSLDSVKGGEELEEIRRLVGSASYDASRIRIDPSVVRGLEYYTGPVFEAELTFPVTNDKGETVVFGSVGGGGRYDGLVGRFRGEDVPATGFSIGVSRLKAALDQLNGGGTDEGTGPVVVLVMDRERIAAYQAMVAQIRNAGIPAELYLGESGMRAQMKYADRRNAPLVVIQGGDEAARGMVQIKDLLLGKQLSETVDDNAAWREERPGQEEVAEAALVEAVGRVLERQKRKRP